MLVTLCLVPALLLATTPTSEPQLEYPTFGLTGTMAYGNLAKHPDGRILCAIAVKAKDRMDSIYISSTRNAGKTWTAAIKVMDIKGQPGYIADPNVLFSPDGVRVFATYVPMTDGKYSRSEFLVSYSADGRHNWTKPAALDLP